MLGQLPGGDVVGSTLRWGTRMPHDTCMEVTLSRMTVTKPKTRLVAITCWRLLVMLNHTRLVAIPCRMLNHTRLVAMTCSRRMSKTQP